ncbi:MAG: peroxiredoxin family protein [Pyrinomonadaceae bacterium]
MNFISPRASSRKSFWTPARLALSLTIFALLSTLTATSCSQSTSETNSNAVNTNSPAVVSSNNGSVAEKPTASGAAAPARAGARDPMPPSVRDAELQMLDGKPVKLSDYAGKVVVLNFWATWCGPCRQETPHLVELSNEYKARGVEFIGLSVEEQESSTEAVKSFASAQKIPYKVGWAAEDFALQFVMQGGAQGSIPQSFVITRDGRLLKHFTGFSPVSTPAQLRQAIEQALDDDSNA